MSERKVLQKYYPPDFDPSAMKRRRTGGGKQKTVRLMAPFSMRCNTCGEYIYRGKKFNARKETVHNDDYYGIPIYRFYIKCSQCSAEITFKTDPKNADYAAEHGAQRNFEPWRDKEEDKVPEPVSDDGEENSEEEEPEIDPMKALEKRMEESQREMEVMDALQDIRTRNARFERMDTSTVLQAIDEGKRKAASMAPPADEDTHEEDEALVRKYFRKEVPEGEEEARVVRSALSENHTPAPDAVSLLSERTKEQLKTILPPPASASTKPAATAAKRRRGPNALGIVRKS
ncbi:Pre-mRNA-splicing factor Cwf16 [Malassezia pachydermatis]|uniref:Splicing factor YJU2 n=1 Tax=Malassezia pachydermatis TaxID=77020 RepID=A0A0M8MRX0_9BASI|nr:hypothetical protein Malapachy_1463 [Malassezia pachydermatis]KOS13104.1 hypothetical protein Malapachy_1463 [Malassezia pachydermatis]